MLKTFILLIFSLLASGHAPAPAGMEVSVPADDAYSLYRELELEGKVNYTAFRHAIDGYAKLTHDRQLNDIITVIDFSKPSTQERFFVIDMKQRMMIFSSHVSHGRNSGGNYATSFSNESGSYKSSLGFFVTCGTYNGRNGYSLVLDGLEKGINDKARERAIVIHGASYCNPETAAGQGRLGRSLGCPALPTAVNKKIIDTIKDGSLLYIYAPDGDYITRSAIIPPQSAS